MFISYTQCFVQTINIYMYITNNSCNNYIHVGGVGVGSTPCPLEMQLFSLITKKNF